MTDGAPSPSEPLRRDRSTAARAVSPDRPARRPPDGDHNHRTSGHRTDAPSHRGTCRAPGRGTTARPCGSGGRGRVSPAPPRCRFRSWSRGCDRHSRNDRRRPQTTAGWPRSGAHPARACTAPASRRQTRNCRTDLRESCRLPRSSSQTSWSRTTHWQGSRWSCCRGGRRTGWGGSSSLHWPHCTHRAAAGVAHRRPPPGAWSRRSRVPRRPPTSADLRVPPRAQWERPRRSAAVQMHRVGVVGDHPPRRRPARGSRAHTRRTTIARRWAAAPDAQDTNGRVVSRTEARTPGRAALVTPPPPTATGLGVRADRGRLRRTRYPSWCCRSVEPVP